MAKKASEDLEPHNDDTPTNVVSMTGHNASPLTKEETDSLLLVHLRTARADNDTLAQAMEAVKALKKDRNRNRQMIKADGFPLHLVDEILEDEGRPRYECEAEEELRRSMREAASVPVGGQLQLFSDSFSQTEMDAAHWRGAGLTAGLRGLNNTPPDDCHPEFHQEFKLGWEDGQARLITAQITVDKLNERRA